MYLDTEAYVAIGGLISLVFLTIGMLTYVLGRKY